MDKETKIILAAASILLAILVIVLLLMSGADLSGFHIRKGIHLS